TIHDFALNVRNFATTRETFGFGPVREQLGNLYEPFLAVIDNNHVLSSYDSHVLAGSIAALAHNRPLIISIDLTTQLDPTIEATLEQLCYRGNELSLLLILAFRFNIRPKQLLGIVRDILRERFMTLTLDHLADDESLQLVRTLTWRPEVESTSIQQSAGN